MKMSIFSVPMSFGLSTIISIVLAFVFPVDFILGAMGVTAGWFAIGKISWAYQILTERVVARKSDVFRIPFGFFIYLLIIVGIAGALCYLSFFKIQYADLHPQTVTNLRFFSSAMGLSLAIGLLRWIDVRKDLRIAWEQRDTKSIGRIHLPQN